MSLKVADWVRDPNKNEEVYSAFQQYVLPFEDLKKWGFPYVDPEEHGKVHFCSNPLYNKSLKPEDQKCRCGKALSLLDANWYYTPEGCFYHTGRKLPSKKGKIPKYERYDCCKSRQSPIGCTRGEFHTCVYHPLIGSTFIKTSNKQDKCEILQPNVYALDCEMIYTTGGMEAVKVSVVSVSGDVVYDTYFQPIHPVVDYCTKYSGVTSKELDGVETTLQDVQKRLLQLFDAETILIGHGLENDLLCLNMVHENIIDTSLVFKHSKGFPYRYSLKRLARSYLKKKIHNGKEGHSSTDDAIKCIDLMLYRTDSPQKDLNQKSKKSKGKRKQKNKALNFELTEFRSVDLYDVNNMRSS